MLPVVQPAAVTQPTTHTGRLGATAVPEAKTALEASATATAMDFMVSLVQRRVRMLLGSRESLRGGLGYGMPVMRLQLYTQHWPRLLASEYALDRTQRRRLGGTTRQWSVWIIDVNPVASMTGGSGTPHRVRLLSARVMRA